MLHTIKKRGDMVYSLFFRYASIDQLVFELDYNYCTPQEILGFFSLKKLLM